MIKHSGAWMKSRPALLASCVAILLTVSSAQTSKGYDLQSYIVKSFGHGEYVVARTPLRKDENEILVYNSGPDHCGSGGCTLFVLEPSGKSFQRIANVPTSWLPIRVLESTSKGWHDLAVWKAGGGEGAHWGRLRFDGHRYHASAKTVREDEAGQIVIAKNAKHKSF